MSKFNFKMLFGLFLISFGVFLQVLWLVVCFGSVIVGILLLLFAPGILFFPFNFFFTLGMHTIGKEFRKNSNNRYYRYHFKYGRNNDYNRGYKRENYSYNSPSDNDIDKYYKILESKRTDPFDVIKKNYRRLIKKYHYDTLASQGLSQQELKEAEERTKEINEAYSKIKEIHKNR